MRGQISLETLIVLAAFAGVFLMLIDNYNELFDIIMGKMDQKRANYAASLLQDATDNCEGLSATISLPFSVEIDCEGGKTVVRVGDAAEYVNGLKCGGQGTGQRLSIENCTVKII